MSARGTKLQEYKNAAGASVFAAQITAIEDFNEPHAPVGSRTLFFTKLGGRQSRSHLIGSWIREYQPEVGGYFIIEDESNNTMSCRYMGAAAFEEAFKPVEENENR